MSASGNYAEDEDLEDPYAASDPETLTSRLLAERSLSEGGADGFGGVGSIAAAVKTVLEEGQHETGNSSSVREATCSFSEAETANLNARVTHWEGGCSPPWLADKASHRDFLS